MPSPDPPPEDSSNLQMWKTNSSSRFSHSPFEHGAMSKATPVNVLSVLSSGCADRDEQQPVVASAIPRSKNTNAGCWKVLRYPRTVISRKFFSSGNDHLEDPSDSKDPNPMMVTTGWANTSSSSSSLTGPVRSGFIASRRWLMQQIVLYCWTLYCCCGNWWCCMQQQQWAIVHCNGHLFLLQNAPTTENRRCWNLKRQFNLSCQQE